MLPHLAITLILGDLVTFTSGTVLTDELDIKLYNLTIASRRTGTMMSICPTYIRPITGLAEFRTSCRRTPNVIGHFDYWRLRVSC